LKTTDWFIGSEDGFHSGPYPTKAAAKDEIEPIIRTTRIRSGEYEVITGYPEEESHDCYYVFREGTSLHQTLVVEEQEDDD
jgi:hypothetical protein